MAVKVVTAKVGPGNCTMAALLERRGEVGVRIGVEADARDVVQEYRVWRSESRMPGDGQHQHSTRTGRGKTHLFNPLRPRDKIGSAACSFDNLIC